MSRARQISVVSLRTLAGLVCLAAVTGCATGIFALHRHPSRAEAIQRCTKQVPPDAVPYADAMQDCMEGYGWRYQGIPRAAEG